MKHLFITGMGRSGTTLLDKLLTNLEGLDILSQPLPLLFVNAKKQFLKTKGIDKYFVLNDDYFNRKYASRDFDDFLEQYSVTHEKLESIFHSQRKYSGQTTKSDIEHIENSGTQHGFKHILEKCLEFYQLDPNRIYTGTKEIMCEEFIPYLCKVGYKCILIIRDPRDVLASVNYPKGTKYLGEKRPSLFVLRSWRKSVECAFALREQKNLLFLRYEDLVDDPHSELEKIAKFLNIEGVPHGFLKKGILDRNGNAWQANTSFEKKDSFISKKSKGIYKQTLSTQEIKYTEVICQYEMGWLKYPLEFDVPSINSIKSFKDSGIKHNQHLSANYSSQSDNIVKEIERLKNFSEFYVQN